MIEVLLFTLRLTQAIAITFDRVLLIVYFASGCKAFKKKEIVMIHINQVAFGKNSSKSAVITGEGKECIVVSADTKIKLFPEVSEPKFDEASGDTVRTVDFSEINKPGEYFIFSDGLKKTFYIKDEPYRELTNALVKGMYYQRCGTALEEKHAGVYKHKPCHLGKSTLESDKTVKTDATGGWHDAGDYGKYVLAGAVAVAHILYAYELFPKAFEDNLNIPESGNGIPDVLNECRYELEWILKMQDESGGVYHKTATRFFAPFIMPEDDLEELVLFDISHTATATFAAVCALSYRCYKNIDADFADKMLAGAVKAWKWLENNPGFKPFINPPNVNSGEYGDDNGDDELFWAAAELFTTTGEEKYKKVMGELVEKVDISRLGWRDVGGIGAMSCLFGKGEQDPEFVSGLRKRFITAADDILALCDNSGYGTALSPGGYVWGSILPIMSNAIVLICANLLSENAAYINAAQSQLDYMLGKNAVGYCFVSGFGQNPVRYLHHRPSFADGTDDPVPGLVSGGPNNLSPDEACKEIIPQGTPPAKFFIDHTETASANENAIYWNSPAIFAAAYFSVN